MSFDIGIRLVILLPTFLFFVGFVFKSIVENKFSKKLLKSFKDNRNMYITFQDRLNDYSIEIAIDSLFILIANGLIIIFELHLNELGILSIIFGVIFSILLLISIYTEADLRIGFSGIFGLLGGEFIYFLFYDVGLPYIRNYYYITTTSIGVIFGLVIYYLIYENTYKNFNVIIQSDLDDEESILDDIDKKKEEIGKEMENLITKYENLKEGMETEERNKELFELHKELSELHKELSELKYKLLEVAKKHPNLQHE